MILHQEFVQCRDEICHFLLFVAKFIGKEPFHIFDAGEYRYVQCYNSVPYLFYIHATFHREVYRVLIPVCGYRHIIFFIVRNKLLYKEVGQYTRGFSCGLDYGNLLVHPLFDPGFYLIPGLIHVQEIVLPPLTKELVRLGHQLFCL